MATEFPARGQRSPNFWDQQLKAYIDESTNEAEIEPGSPLDLSLIAKQVAAFAASIEMLADMNTLTDSIIGQVTA